MIDSPDKGSAYILGRSETERQRLRGQADLLARCTRRFLLDAGIDRDMHVLEVGCGVGDVSLLLAELVGPQGSVTGIDLDPVCLETARRRAADADVANVSFLHRDARTLSLERPLDAAVGRFVLIHLGDVIPALRQIAVNVRVDGIIAFQEFDFTVCKAVPRAETAYQILEWWCDTAARMGLELELGSKLFPAFRAAGLPGPEMHLDAMVGGGPSFPGYEYLAGIIRSIQPMCERLGVAAPEEIAIDSLADRLRAEVVQGGGVLVLPSVVGAWTRKTPARGAEAPSHQSVTQR